VIGRGSRDVEAIVDKYINSFRPFLEERGPAFADGKIEGVQHPLATFLAVAAWVTSEAGRERLLEVACEGAAAEKAAA
jgi:hypothetical protein